MCDNESLRYSQSFKLVYVKLRLFKKVIRRRAGSAWFHYLGLLVDRLCRLSDGGWLARGARFAKPLAPQEVAFSHFHVEGKFCLLETSF
jgi:hypothetical protein